MASPRGHDRCGRQCGLQSADAGPVRGHGRDLFARHFPHRKIRASAFSPSARKSTRVTSLTRDATPLLKTLNLNFIGNVEGRDVYTGAVDVIVCDGFVGNVALKVSEGLVEVVREMLRESMRKTCQRQIGALPRERRVRRFQKARGLHRVRRRAAARLEGHLYYLPRPLEREGPEERDSGRSRIRRRQDQRSDCVRTHVLGIR